MPRSPRQTGASLRVSGSRSAGAAALAALVGMITLAAAPSQAEDENPAIAWEQPDIELDVVEGSQDWHLVRLTASGDLAENVRAHVSRELTDVVHVDVDHLSIAEDGTVEVPVRVSLPTGSQEVYQGDVRLTAGEGELGPALSLEVQAVEATATKVLDGAAAPSEDRIVTMANGQKVVEDELVVGVELDHPDPDGVIKALAGDLGAVIQGSVPESRTYQLRFPDAVLDDVHRARDEVAGVPGVDFAALNVVADEPLSRTPNDPLWGDWSVQNPGGNNWGLEWIDAPGAWDRQTGSAGVRIGVIDSDFDRNHTDLNDNVGSLNARGLRAGGHGTHVAGTICAEGNNGVGITGVTWDCDLRLYAYGTDTVTTQQAMVQAAAAGSRAVNMSLQFVENNQCGTPGTALSLQLVADANAVLGRAILAAQQARQDVLWVFAAGNECRDARFASPASLVNEFPTNTMTVAAIDRDGRLSGFSNRGNLVTVAAPGRDILSTLPQTCFLPDSCADTYGSGSGTSMAAPHVTGLAALLFADRPTLTASAAKSCIVSGARSAGTPVPGHAFWVIDAPAALACNGTLSLPPVVDLVLALDLSSSMGDVLQQAKDQAEQAVAALRAASPSTDFRVGVVSFEDYAGSFGSAPCGSAYSAMYGADGDSPFRLHQPLTADAAVLDRAVDALELHWGGDIAESYGRTLWEVAQPDTGAALGWRSGALKLVVTFGDGVPHDTNLNAGVVNPLLLGDTGVDPGRNGVVDCGGDDIDFQDDALADLRAAGIRLLHVDRSGIGTEPYWRFWTSRTGGAYTTQTPSDGRSLSDVLIELLRLVPRTP